jgi:hypothetical protein
MADFNRFREFRQRILDGGNADADSIVASNPAYYHSYVLAGNMRQKEKDYKGALRFYEQALTMEIATRQEKDFILQQVKICKEALNK